MGLFIAESDFLGKYGTAKTPFTNLDKYIDKYETRYLKDLLGAELYALFFADLTGTAPNKLPQTAKYLAIFNAFDEDWQDGWYCWEWHKYCYASPARGRQNNSNGIKEMLLGFIWWEYQRDQSFKPTPSGIVKGQAELSRETTFSEVNLAGRYNEALKSYWAIQWVCFTKKQTDYPKFNGLQKGMIDGRF